MFAFVSRLPCVYGLVLTCASPLVGLQTNLAAYRLGIEESMRELEECQQRLSDANMALEEAQDAIKPLNEQRGVLIQRREVCGYVCWSLAQSHVRAHALACPFHHAHTCFGP